MNEQTFFFELTLNEANAILAGLGKLPFEIADPIIKKIQSQAQNQDALKASLEGGCKDCTCES